MQQTHEQHTSRVRLLVGFTGSVATIKDAQLLQALQETGIFEVRTVYTKAALHFKTFDESQAVLRVFRDEDEWAWRTRGDPVLHIELRKWAELLLIAPLSANTLAKLSNGLCDNLLTCVFRAWDFSRLSGDSHSLRYPVIVAPAMNSLMWDSPFTSRHLQTLRELGVVCLDTVEKQLVCGDKGKGAMQEVAAICAAVVAAGQAIQHRPGRSLQTDSN